MIAIVDYGMGNLGSIVNMLKKVGARAQVTADPDEITRAQKIILPGVGAFDSGMGRLRELGLVHVLNKCVLEAKTPVLGLCLGMQLLTEGSEEGSEAGLGWLAARTVHFRFDPRECKLKIPHMGWNTLSVMRPGNLFVGLEQEPRYYFVHSFHVECDDSSDVLATANHGYPFAAAVQRDNIMGTQFHPEKSHRYGMQLMRNFVECC